VRSSELKQSFASSMNSACSASVNFVKTTPLSLPTFRLISSQRIDLGGADADRVVLGLRVRSVWLREKGRSGVWEINHATASGACERYRIKP
jgi:hypothetical protein